MPVYLHALSKGNIAWDLSHYPIRVRVICRIIINTDQPYCLSSVGANKIEQDITIFIRIELFHQLFELLFIGLSLISLISNFYHFTNYFQYHERNVFNFSLFGSMNGLFRHLVLDLLFLLNNTIRRTLFLFFLLVLLFWVTFFFVCRFILFFISNIGLDVALFSHGLHQVSFLIFALNLWTAWSLFFNDSRSSCRVINTFTFLFFRFNILCWISKGYFKIKNSIFELLLPLL